MITNLILCIIIFSIIIYIIHNTNKKNVVEPFNVTEPINIDQNFKVDINKISKERSVRFSKNKVYNQSRVVYGFNDLEYFNKNIDNIFYFYGINDEKIKSYFREKYSLVNKNLNVDISKLSVADKKYYESLEQSDKAGESTIFISYMLEVIKESLQEMSVEIISVTKTYEDRIEKAKDNFQSNLFSRKHYMEVFKNISSATASRDLKDALEQGRLARQGENNQTRYRFI